MPKGRDILGGLPNRTRAATPAYRDHWCDVFGPKRPAPTTCWRCGGAAHMPGEATLCAPCKTVLAHREQMDAQCACDTCRARREVDASASLAGMFS